MVLNERRLISLNKEKGRNNVHWKLYLTRGDEVSAGFEHHYCFVTQIEKDEVFCLMGHERTKVSPYDDVPMWCPPCIKFCLYLFSTRQP